MWEYLFGYAAATMSALSAFPQVYHTYKKKTTEDISFLYVSNLIIIAILWTTYGVLIFDGPLILSSSCCGSGNVILLLMKLYYEKRLCFKPQICDKPNYSLTRVTPADLQVVIVNNDGTPRNSIV